MFWNFIKGTFKSILGYKSFTTINIFGLAIGISCSIIIGLYLLHEYAYDKFHSNSEDVYRITLHGEVQGITFNGAPTSAAMGAAIRKDIQEVESLTRLTILGAWLVSNDSIRYNEDNILFADTNFFAFFDGFKVLYGNLNHLLNKPQTIVLTESTARKYFNRVDVVGEKLLLETGDKYYTITGVVKDVPSNSHIQFDMVASLVTYKKHGFNNWVDNSLYTYLRLKKNTSVPKIVEELNGFVVKYVLPQFDSIMESPLGKEDRYEFNLQAMENIHLHSALQQELQPNGNATYVYAFGIVAILILIITCLNFMNLSSANSVNRAKEVVLRKVAGGGRRVLILQFLTESVVFSFAALILALLLTEIFLPLFNVFFDLTLKFSIFSNPKAILTVVVFTLFVGLLAGSYPAFFISSFEPVKVLQGKLNQGVSNSKVRAIFVVVQFFISILIIILTIVIFAQTKFMMHKDLGFDQEHVVVIRRSDALGDDINKFKKELLKDDNIISATNSNAIPGRSFNNTTFAHQHNSESTNYLLNQIFVSYDFKETYQLELLQGRFFNPEIASDSFACVINERAAKLMGLGYPVGNTLEQPYMFKKYKKHYTIIGMVKNFHFQSVDKPIQPLIICFMPGNWEGFINVKITPRNREKTLAYMEKVWNSYTPEYPFVYFDLLEDFNKSYNSQVKLGRIFLLFSVLAVLIACLGLFGLIAYVTSQRFREIGIRKALGASVTSLVLTISKETFKLVLIASVLAWGVGFLLAKYWLGGFYYKINLSPLYFVFAALLVLAIALLTVFVQAYRAATMEPGKALKYE